MSAATKGETSMFDTVKDHGERIVILEKRIENVENNYINLENTILKGNQSQQDFFRDTMKNQWELIKERDNTKEETAKRQHELLIGKQAMTASNWSKVWEFSGKLFTAGGVGYLIFEAFFNK